MRGRQRRRRLRLPTRVVEQPQQDGQHDGRVGRQLGMDCRQDHAVASNQNGGPAQFCELQAVSRQRSGAKPHLQQGGQPNLLGVPHGNDRLHNPYGMRSRRKEIARLNDIVVVLDHLIFIAR